MKDKKLSDATHVFRFSSWPSWAVMFHDHRMPGVRNWIFFRIGTSDNIECHVHQHLSWR